MREEEEEEEKETYVLIGTRTRTLWLNYYLPFLSGQKRLSDPCHLSQHSALPCTVPYRASYIHPAITSRVCPIIHEYS